MDGSETAAFWHFSNGVIFQPLSGECLHFHSFSVFVFVSAVLTTKKYFCEDHQPQIHKLKAFICSHPCSAHSFRAYAFPGQWPEIKTA